MDGAQEGKQWELSDLPKAMQQVSGREEKSLCSSAQDCVHRARIIPGKAATVRPQNQIITHLVLFVAAWGDEMQMVLADVHFQILCVWRLKCRSRIFSPSAEQGLKHEKGIQCVHMLREIQICRNFFLKQLHSIAV